MAEQAFNQPLVVIPASSSTDFVNTPTINPNNEPVVDIMAGTDSAVSLVAWVNPGVQVGDELIVRMIRRTPSASGGVDAGNKAKIRLKVIHPGNRQQDLDYVGFKNATVFEFPAFLGTPLNGNPSTVVFRWNGVSWLVALSDLPVAA